MNILHLSDIHFGHNHYSLPDPFDRKDEILSKLIDTISGLPVSMKPDLILVTGDIAWRGKTSEFNEAFEWFQQLIEALGIESNQVVFCPGNHDLNRNVATSFKETDLQNSKKRLDIQKCDEYSNYENMHLLEPRFHNYNLFCKKMNMQPYSYTLDDGTVEYSYLVGSNHFTFAGRLLTGGAAYYNDEHPNSFSIIHIDNSRNIEVCSFYFNGNDWSPFHPLNEYHWQRETGIPVWENPITDYPVFTFFVDIDGIQRPPG